MKNIHKIYILLLLLLTVIFVQAQDKTDPKDSDNELPYNFSANQNGGLFLNSSDTEVIYDAETGQYIFLEKIGDYYVKRPIYMTAKEYEAYRLKQDMLTYYQSKADAIDGKKEGSDDAKKDLLPKYYINNKFFTTIFGSNEIEVNAQGNVLVKFGLLYQKTENPRLSEKQRSSKTFDFDQQISASVNAKVGTRLGVNINYDTQSTFDFQNLIKLDFNPNPEFGEDDLIQKIEVGNVSMPLQSSLIKGAQNLFGGKVKLKFGPTEITMVGAKQQSQTRSVAAQGGATVHEFELRASDYDKDRHFFLSQRFRNDYDKALANFPLINSAVNITRVEVWITNRNTATENVRNIVAIADLGERNPNLIVNTTVSNFTGQNPSNEANSLNELLTIDGDIRHQSTLSAAFNSFGLSNFNQGSDYTTLVNAKKLIANTDFTIHPQLGYISLNRALTESEVLAVAYQYTENGQVYNVGELSDNGIIAPANLVVKLLRPEIISTNLTDVIGTNRRNPLWDLMMKNVYDLRSFQMNPDGFRLEILFQDNTTGVPLNTLQNATTANVNTKPLINLLQVDRLDSANNFEDRGDGFFDYVEGVTVNSQKGLIIFPKIEPFGGFLDGIEGTGLLNDVSDEEFIFREMYELTQSDAQNNYQTKDKYLIKGYYKSEGQNGIPLGAFNVPRGSVVVTTGGRNLVEGVDYVVDYQIGNVQIINPALISSNAPIQVSVETNNAFSTQNRTFYGIDVQHKFSEKLAIGGTYLKLNEKPFTQKAQFGTEPVNNSIAGLNLTYNTSVPKITKWVNYLPNIDTDAVSNFSIRAEAAYLMPNSPKGIELNGEATSYLDDFESTQIPLNIDTPTQWSLASVPENQPAALGLDFITADPTNFKYGNRRARFSWYSIDRLFYNSSSLRPDSVDDEELSRAETRRITYAELFPEQEIDVSQTNVIPTLDLAYYPKERGTYNFETNNIDANDKFTEPEKNWGGIMRALTTTDFQQANVEYIQFWMMDPYDSYSITQAEGAPSTINPVDFDGEMYINIGNISEDILHDGSRMFEHGLPKNGIQISDIGADQNVDTSGGYSSIPTIQSLINAFSEEDNERPNQDLGLDGINDTDEKVRFSDFSTFDDPANDNFEYFRSTHLDNINASVLTRYKNYNRTQGNSNTLNNSTEDYPTTGTQFPDTEDLNRDQTLSTAEAYFQYQIKIKETTNSEMSVGNNFIIDKVTKTTTLANGTSKDFTWYQFRIPIQTINNNDPNDLSAISVGNISSFNSIRFMRIFLTKFKIPVVVRLAKLELVRGNWRRYTKILKEPLPTDPALENLSVAANQNFEVGVVSLFSNNRYEMPPGVVQERLRGNTSVQRQNEQSISMKVTDLKPGNTRAVYKNTTFDMRMFKKFKLFVHLEENGAELADDDLVAIVRLGSDIKDNYYQIEVPLKVSATGTTDREEMWKNDIVAALEEFGKLRLERFKDQTAAAPNVLYPTLTNGGFDGKEFDTFKLYVKGNPTLSKVKTMMLGVKNNTIVPKSAELWFNEMRVVDFDNKGGWSAVANANLNLADFADIAASGGMSTKGFGSLDQRVNERSQEDVMNYDIVSNISVGQLFPKNYGIKLPLNVSISEELKNPKYDPQYQDVLFDNTTIESSPNRDNASDYTKRRSISLINVRKERTNQKKKQRLYDVENLSVSFAYNDTHHHDYNIEKANDKNVRATASYNFSFQPKPIEPFKKSKFAKKKYLKIIKDFNFNYLPSTISVNSNINRTYNEYLSRPLVQSSILPDLPTLERRNYAFDWDYTVAYDLTKALQFNFRAANSYINDYFDKNDDNEVINGQIFNKFFAIGRPEHYHQKLDATYKLPIDKIPAFDFIKSTYSYTADFDWQAASRNNIELVGNTLQNANTHNFNADLNMDKLYKKLGINRIFNKSYNQSKARERKAKKAAKDKAKGKEKPKDKEQAKDRDKDTEIKNETANQDLATNEKIGSRKGSKAMPGGRSRLNRSKGKSGRKAGRVNRKKLPFGKKLVLNLIDIVISVKKVRLSYTENNGTILPGYTHNVGFLGRDSYSGGIAPTFGFVFGQQADILPTALENNWIVARGGTDLNLYPYYNKTYSRTHFDKLDYNLTLKPFKDFSIDVTGNRTYTKNSSQQIDVIDDGVLDPYMINSPSNEIGNFAISHVMIGTSFTDSDQLFNDFVTNRAKVSARLSAESGYNISGYGENSQDVVLPTFIATYSGEDVNKTTLNPFKNIPLPNWRVKYKGLSKIKWIKKRFRAVSLEHNYQSGYSILGYNSNLNYNANNPLQTDIANNYVSKTLYSGVNLVEAFSPLIKLDVKMKNSFSFRGAINTDRSLDLNFANSSITEIKGKEYIVGLGYKLKNVVWKMKLGENNKTFKGDVNFKADFGIRNNETHIRSYETLSDQITGGQTIMTFKFTADYNLNKNLMASFFYDQNSSKFAISTSFPRNSINTGISIRYNIGN